MKRLIPALLLTLAVTGQAIAQEPLKVVARAFEPFSYLDENGDPAGVEYEILQYFAKSQGREIDIVWVETFAELMPRFDQGDVDLASGTVSITASREEMYDFSSSYFPVRIRLVEPRTQTASTLDDLAGETLITMSGTTYERVLSTISEVSFVYAGDENEELAMLDRGEGRATALDSVLGLLYLKDYPSLHMTLPISELQHYGFLVAEGSPLAAELSKHLDQLKLSGIYFRILRKYLGQEAVDLVQWAKE